jgi:hypothetical protein
MSLATFGWLLTLGGKMKIVVVGSRSWKDYNYLMRKLTIIIEDWAKSNDEEPLIFIHQAQSGAEDMVTEYIGKTEKFLKQKGLVVRERVFPRSDNQTSRDYEMLSSGVDEVIIFLSKNPCKRSASFAKIAEAHEIKTTVIKE